MCRCVSFSHSHHPPQQRQIGDADRGGRSEEEGKPGASKAGQERDARAQRRREAREEAAAKEAAAMAEEDEEDEDGCVV